MEAMAHVVRCFTKTLWLSMAMLFLVEADPLQSSKLEHVSCDNPMLDVDFYAFFKTHMYIYICIYIYIVIYVYKYIIYM